LATRPNETTISKRREILRFGVIWFVAGYAVVSLSMTKFHHYILPALPGLAIVVGCSSTICWAVRDNGWRSWLPWLEFRSCFW
jgi:4-amino-4-deoxy-L-arabinose transferase-like glycosyltransferase